MYCVYRDINKGKYLYFISRLQLDIVVLFILTLLNISIEEFGTLTFIEITGIFGFVLFLGFLICPPFCLLSLCFLSFFSLLTFFYSILPYLFGRYIVCIYGFVDYLCCFFYYVYYKKSKINTFYFLNNWTFKEKTHSTDLPCMTSKNMVKRRSSCNLLIIPNFTKRHRFENYNSFILFNKKLCSAKEKEKVLSIKITHLIMKGK